jgi:uncharacterized protein
MTSPLAGGIRSPVAGPEVTPTPVSRPFWEGLADEKVLIQRCDSCGSWVYYPRLRCPTCLSDRLNWQQVAPEGIVYTFSIARHPIAPWFPADPPLIIGVVELENGVRLTTNIIDADPERLSIGAEVAGVFEHRSDVTLLKFRPTGIPTTPSR